MPATEYFTGSPAQTSVGDAAVITQAFAAGLQLLLEPRLMTSPVARRTLFHPSGWLLAKMCG